ncbi:MAG: hypothetical protein JEZ03_08025 [Bacteroidales bacterium]|nr:hypothetical protein [Bacteroidales bacterium]
MKNIIRITIGIIFSILFVFTACKKDDNDNPNVLTAKTIYKSSSLANHSKSGVLGDSLALTPYNITGEALSLLFATASEVDEGLVVFGDGRPDIAPADAALLPFDFANQLAINSNITLKPGYIGGTVQHMVSLFGYIDIHVTIESTDRLIRLALGHYNLGSNSYVRGDVLLQDTLTGEYRFYDLNNFVFTTARPTNPYVIEEIRDFTDPIRPNMVFYPLNIFLNPSITLDATALQNGSSIDVVVDFLVENFILLENQSTASNISDSAIINSFELSQNVVGYGNSGLSAIATVVINP